MRSKNGIDIWGDSNFTSSRVVNLKKGVNYLSYKFQMNINNGEYLFCAGLAAIKENGEREELDHRWPLGVMNIVSENGAVGYVYAPVRVLFPGDCADG